MLEIIMKLIMGAMLFLCSIQDIRYKRIRIWVVVLCAILMSICIPFLTSNSMMDRVGGSFVGGGVVLLSILTRGKIGMGDGIILCATGIGLGLWVNLELFAYALFLAAIVSIVLLVLRLVNRKHSIPFVPFLFLSYIGIIVAR